MTAFIFKHVIIGIIAVTSLAIILVQLLLTVFGGLGDFDTDGDGDMDFDSSIFLSPKGILHFLAGSAWYLVLIDKDVLLWYDYIIAILVGIAAAAFIALIYWGMSKLTKETVEEKGDDLVNRPVEVYLKTGENQYDAFVIKNGAKVVISVKTKDQSDLKPGTTSVITSYEGGVYYIG